MSTIPSEVEAIPGSGSSAALALSHVDVAYRVRRAQQRIVRDVSFSVARGESFGLVGESGCGKSTIALAIVRYLASNGSVPGGQIEVDGKQVLDLGREDLRKLRANSVAMVYQEPGRALNPSITVGDQVAEVYEIHGAKHAEALERAEAMLGKVQISNPSGVMKRYPHQLSGGMLQRVVIGMALAAEPTLLILDEPTTALDATVESEVLELIQNLRKEVNTALLFISHNLGVITKMCDRVGVLYAGELVEEGKATEVFANPHHPYTVGLIRSIPRRENEEQQGDGPSGLQTIPGSLPLPGSIKQGCVFAPRCGLADERCRTETPPLFDLGHGRSARCYYHEKAKEVPLVGFESETSTIDLRPATRNQADSPAPTTTNGAGTGSDPLVRVRDLGKTFTQGGQSVRGLLGVDLDIYAGETVGLVGESGSGKTTMARLLMGIIAPDQGSVLQLDGHDLHPLAQKRTTEQQKSLQIIFQNPDSALNRRHSIRRLVSRPLAKLGGYKGQQLQDRLIQLLESVRLSERYLPMRPVQLSGGLKQRVAIARAFAGDPRIVVCDEPTSALDVSVQAAILNLLSGLQESQQVSYLFISHDLGVVRYLSHRIVVLYLGRVMEVGPAERVFDGPHHPYTEALLSAVPSLDDSGQHRIRLEGEIPSSADPPSGCPFQTRCHRKLGAVCEETEPPLVEVEDGHSMRCHIPLEELRELQLS
jgi:peptide/nickel transport system ATP-binding protein